jgi:hypothetical protein
MLKVAGELYKYGDPALIEGNVMLEIVTPGVVGQYVTPVPLVMVCE